MGLYQLIKSVVLLPVNALGSIIESDEDTIEDSVLDFGNDDDDDF